MVNKNYLKSISTSRTSEPGKTVALETVDFNDPHRPKTCLEIDFPILPINQVATIEGKGSGALKPIYQMSKWWARRRSNVFRSILLAAATRAPENTSHAAKLIWSNYYANHQKKGAYNNIKVADIFMGGGTTLIEGSRLGMQMYGNDLNPVAWFVVKQEIAKIDRDELKNLLAEIEAEVKPQIMPYYFCDGPDGKKGTWTHIPTGRIEGPEFDPLALTQEQRYEYQYEGPEIIYTFWSKHGQCGVTGCGHRTPIISSPVFASKDINIKYWEVTCSACTQGFHVEEKPIRMAPNVPLYVSSTEKPYSVLDPKCGIICVHCGHSEIVKLNKGKNKKVKLSLLLHPQWLSGSSKSDLLGGSAQDDAESTELWSMERASKIRLLEVRGLIPDTVTCPETNITFHTNKDGGNVPKPACFTCRSCGTVQGTIEATRFLGKTAPLAAYSVQAYSEELNNQGNSLRGRYYLPFDNKLARQYSAAFKEWEMRKEGDLAPYWPKDIKIPDGFNSTQAVNHGYSHWWTMFNARQLLVHAQLLKAITTVGNYSWETREYVLGAFQQYLRNQNMFCFWNIQRALEPLFSNNNFHPKTNPIENSCFSGLGRGDFFSSAQKIIESIDWSLNPWEISCLPGETHSEKVNTGDPLLQSQVEVDCKSSTELNTLSDAKFDLIVTDPPFGGLLHYSELSDFFYVWLRLVLRKRYPEQFASELTPKALEVVANSKREPENPNAFYQKLLTKCWRESCRILKPGGILVFTFHHSEDEPWVAVLESLFDAGFYLEATYPIRSDETKGDGAFGSKTIEYDIIHVCRKLTEASKPVSWGRMRREILSDVRQIQEMLENHAKEGLPTADLQVIRRGKALEYFSRHYGKVYLDEGRAMNVKEALVGINQLIDEDTKDSHLLPPVSAEPMTRQFLRIFDGKTEVARDQMQKFMKGTGTTPDEFEEHGWCVERNKVFTLVNPLQFAQEWQRRHKRNLISDFDQAWVLIGACYEDSGINASETLKNSNFKPHPALKALLEWFSKQGANLQIRHAASRAGFIYKNWFDSWAQANQKHAQQITMFFEGDL